MAVKKIISYHGGAIFRPWSVSTDQGVIKRFRTLEKARDFRDSTRNVELIQKVNIFAHAFNLIEHNLAIVLGVAIASGALSLFGLGH